MTAQVVLVGRRNGKASEARRWIAEREAAGLAVVRMGRDGRTLAAMEKTGAADLTTL